MKDDKRLLASAALCFVAVSLLLVCIYLRLFFYFRGYFMVWQNALESGQITQLFVWWWLLETIGTTFAPCGRYRIEMESNWKPYFRPHMTWPCSSVPGHIVGCGGYVFIYIELRWYGNQWKSTCYVAVGFVPYSHDEMLKMSMRLWFHLRFTVGMLRPSCWLMLSPHWGYRCAFDGELTETQSLC